MLVNFKALRRCFLTKNDNFFCWDENNAHISTIKHHFCAFIMAQQNIVYLLLGANLGNPAETFAAARSSISAQYGGLLGWSSVYQTAPWGVTDQPVFLNQVVVVQTHLHPLDVLRFTQSLEKTLGRQPGQRWGPRQIDIDILYYGQMVATMPDLTVPHPRLHERRFTLVPLVEVAPEFIHPKLKLTNEQLLARCEDHTEAPQLATPSDQIQD